MKANLIFFLSILRFCLASDYMESLFKDTVPPENHGNIQNPVKSLSEDSQHSDESISEYMKSPFRQFSDELHISNIFEDAKNPNMFGDTKSANTSKHTSSNNRINKDKKRATKTKVKQSSNKNVTNVTEATANATDIANGTELLELNVTEHSKMSMEDFVVNVILDLINFCNQSFPIPLTIMEELEQGYNRRVSQKVKCFFHCFMTQSGAMDEDGMIHVAKVVHLVQPTAAMRGDVERALTRCIPKMPKRSAKQQCNRSFKYVKCVFNTMQKKVKLRMHKTKDKVKLV